MQSSTLPQSVRFALHSTAKAALKACSPGLLNKTLAWRARARCKRLYGPLAETVKEKLYGSKPIEVLDGPFKGLKFTDHDNHGVIIPKWIGTYESQLHPILESVIQSREYQTIINIGAAEGYYSVGLAWRLPQASVYSYDIDMIARRAQRRLAQANGVTNLSIGEYCSHEELARRIVGHTLVICDIEGSEYELLDLARCPALSRADILLEVHCKADRDLANSDKEELIALANDGWREMLSRFAPSHCIQTIEESVVDPSKCEILSKILPQNEVEAALSEGRQIAMTWLWMTSKTSDHIALADLHSPGTR